MLGLPRRHRRAGADRRVWGAEFGSDLWETSRRDFAVCSEALGARPKEATKMYECEIDKERPPGTSEDKDVGGIVRQTSE